MCMAFLKKVWVDRVSQYPDRRTLVNVNTGAVSTCDITREEGNISVEGTQLNATNFNNLEDRIDASIDELTTALNSKQATLTAGTGISIVNNVISISLTDADTQEY